MQSKPISEDVKPKNSLDPDLGKKITALREQFSELMSLTDAQLCIENSNRRAPPGWLDDLPELSDSDKKLISSRKIPEALQGEEDSFRAASEVSLLPVRQDQYVSTRLENLDIPSKNLLVEQSKVGEQYLLAVKQDLGLSEEDVYDLLLMEYNYKAQIPKIVALMKQGFSIADVNKLYDIHCGHYFEMSPSLVSLAELNRIFFGENSAVESDLIINIVDGLQCNDQFQSEYGASGSVNLFIQLYERLKSREGMADPWMLINEPVYYNDNET